MLPTLTWFLTLLLCILPSASAFSFSISSRVVQCANLSITWDGGVAPWNIILIPVGALKSGPEIRTIVDANVTTGNDFSFQLKFPAGSSFLAMMSDATGVGTGGTSVLITVLDGDSSCLATSATKPLFYFFLDKTGNPSQCETWGVSWDNNAQAPVHIIGMIPGGQSFRLPAPTSGTGFDWNVTPSSGTEFLLVAGDPRGFGTGGSTNLFTVQPGSNSCESGGPAPSSTAAPAAGGQYATGSGGGSVTGIPYGGPQMTQGASGSGSKSNIGPIIGGTIGGIAGLIALGLIGLFFWRRRRFHREGAPTKGRNRPVDLLQEEGASPTSGTVAGLAAGTAFSHDHGSTWEDGDGRPMSQADGGTNRPSISSTADGTPIYAQYRRGSAPSLPPSNFGGAFSTTGSESTHGGPTSAGAGPPFIRSSSHGPNPPSAFPAGGGGGRPGTPTGTDTSVRTPGTSAPRPSGKTPMPTLRPVNIIQHDDAGQIPVPVAGASNEEEVVELPPTYQDVRRSSGEALGR